MRWKRNPEGTHGLGWPDFRRRDHRLLPKSEYAQRGRATDFTRCTRLPDSDVKWRSSHEEHAWIRRFRPQQRR